VRYVTPLREGGSLPAVMEADDGDLYVVKFRGAGQGPRVLVAEWIVGEMARRLGFAVPDLVGVELDGALARTEPDPEIQDLLRASVGLNLGMRYLSAALTFDPVADPVDADLAARIVALDAWTVNVDRTARNPNLLWWREALWLIDHGAALYWHHAWDGSPPAAPARFARIRDHVLLARAAGRLRASALRLEDDVLREVVGAVPDDWLVSLPDPAAQRAGYVRWLSARRDLLAAELEEVDRAG
jgi:hypothetical protein